MTHLISFKKPVPETYHGLKIMTDPGVHQAAESEISKHLDPGSAIIEIGAGAGAFSLRLKNNGYDVSAVDIEDGQFDAPGVKFRKIGSEERISVVFENRKFAGVVAIEVIEHFRSTWQFLREADDLLEPGGKLFLTTPNISSLYSRMVFLKEGRFYHFQGADSWRMGHINPVPFFVLEQAAKESGFILVGRQEIGVMPVLDWSGFSLRSLFTALPRLILYLMMGGPGPKDGNVLLYTFKKLEREP